MGNGFGDRAETDGLEEPPLSPGSLSQANVEASSLSHAQAVYDGLHVPGYSERTGDVVGGPDGQDSNRGCAVTQGAGNPCHGAIAACHHHEVPFLGEGFSIVPVLTRLIV